MHLAGIATFDEIGDIAIAAKEVIQLVVTDTGQDCRICDLVAVQMENGQDDAVGEGVEKFVRMPTGRQRAGFRFTIAHDTGNEQVRIIERRAERMLQRVTQLATLVNRPRCLR